MEKKKLEITNKYGLHSRPASELVKVASKYDSEITLSYNGQEANAKSILGIMVLAIEPGAEIELVVDGEDEEEALQALEKLIRNEFYVEYQDEDN
ncbi:MAG: HPr family phosphocarrier protein [Candidatus Marinimicrobia bacterium]|nr:HPr family phosphocarrier protein [Candidatus Neomarinimicrobiota bacterium]